MKIHALTFGVAASLVLTACSDTSVVEEPGGGGTDPTIPDSSTDPVQARLKTFSDGEAFYTALREALVNQADSFGYGSTDDLNIAVPVAAPEAAPQTDSASASDSGSSAGNEVTSTNVQEVGVDEQDRVKLGADGTRLYVLSNDYSSFGFPGIIIDQPAVIDVAEPASTSLPAPQQVGTTIRILSLDPETPDATEVEERTVDLQGRAADGFYLYEADNSTSAVITASGGGYWGYWDQPFAFSGLESVIAKVNVGGTPSTSADQTFMLDGQIISSRRIGDALFFASRYYPNIPGFQPWEQGSQEWRDAVESADLASLMPGFSRNGSDESTPLVDASSCFVAPVPENQPYYSPDIITLGVIDLDTMQLRDAECFLGATETLYATTDSVFLATTQYSYVDGPVTLDGAPVDTESNVFAPDLVWSDPRTSTDIHQFDIQSDQLSYAGSGSVRGHLGWNELQKPFRMSESGGYLRVATMNDQQGPDHSPILLHVLQADGQGNLETISRLPNDSQTAHIGEPGERLYASRFIGDRAYLVTFRQTDPLYVIDLANPDDPRIRGELKIDGYSDYLHPISEGFLLGIGKDAVAATGGRGDGRGDGRGAWVQGIKLSLFDVTDPGAPTEVQSVLVGERGTHSVALGNHRAIMIQPATDQHPTRVSFGIDVYGEAAPTTRPDSEQATLSKRWNYTGLHGFDVTGGPNASISSRGAVVVADSSDGAFPNYGDDRAVMVNDAVFYVYGKQVYPALWDNLGADTSAR